MVGRVFFLSLKLEHHKIVFFVYNLHTRMNIVTYRREIILWKMLYLKARINGDIYEISAE